MPFGQMPVLEIDDKKIVQSSAICRYLGKLVGLAGDNDFESMEIDSVLDTFNDLRLSKLNFCYVHLPSSQKVCQK